MPRFLVAILCLLLAACSLRGAIESMVSPEDRAFAMDMVDHLRRGDEAWLRGHFRPDLWDQSAKQIAAVPELFPTVPGETEIIGFNTSTSNVNGRVERNRNFTLVTQGAGRWTVTTFATFSEGGPDQVVAWNVVPHSSPPPELAMLDGMDAALPWVWGALIVIVVAAGALIFWLIRRSRRIHVPK